MVPDRIDDAALIFLAERHLASFSVPRADGSIQTVPVGVTYTDGIARVITRGHSVKARRIASSPGLPVSVCQIDGGRWMTLEGSAVVTDDPIRVAHAVELYAARYKQPQPNSERVAIEITVTRVLGRW